MSIQPHYGLRSHYGLKLCVQNTSEAAHTTQNIQYQKGHEFYWEQYDDKTTGIYILNPYKWLWTARIL